MQAQDKESRHIIDMDKQPLVSIVMPAYNMGKYIERSIDSVIIQTYTKWELIIIDDCSVDDTFQRIEHYTKKDERIILIRNDRNLGVAKSRNIGIQASKGEYLAFLDSDDIWEPEKLEFQLGIALSIAIPVMIYTSYDFIDEGDNSVLKPYIVPRTTSFKSMLGENVVGCSSVLVSKSAVSKVNGFPTNIYHEDYALWMKLFMQKDFIAMGITKVLMHHRQLDTGRSISKKRAAMHRWKVYRKILGLDITRSICAFLKYTINGLKKYK